MGNLADDTAVQGNDGNYTRVLSRDWEIWGPNGGYVASVALRAAGMHSRFARPASMVGHYLGVASFDAPIEISTITQREAKRAESIRVSIRQAERPILEAMVWAIAEVEGLQHEDAAMPEAPDPTTLQSVAERLADREDAFFYPFWQNFDERPLAWIDDWENRPPAPPRCAGWYRYVPADTFTDPWVDACRSLILIDTMPWPAAQRLHVRGHSFMAPSIDISAAFHRLRPDEPWLLVDATAPIAHDGLVSGHVNVFARGGALLASGVSQLLCRPAPA